jgi:hypothetical protein
LLLQTSSLVGAAHGAHDVVTSLLIILDQLVNVEKPTHPKLTAARASLAWNVAILVMSQTQVSQFGALAQSAAKARRRRSTRFMSEFGVEDGTAEFEAWDNGGANTKINLTELGLGAFTLL